MSAGNKIGDLKQKLNQRELRQEQIDELKEALRDKQSQVVFLSRVNTLMAFLKGKKKLNEIMSLKEYLEALRYRFPEAEGGLSQLRAEHIVHVYEVFE